VLTEAEGIRDKRWWTYEEFNTQGASALGVLCALARRQFFARKAPKHAE
jgi:hypothetical protein